jgi:MinD-like ATPase involved in chromosome partitioning or flagellar assembly
VRTLLATVSGPLGDRDLALPADTPVGELLPVLARLAVPAGQHAGTLPTAWTLSRVGVGPIQPHATLAASGVLNGDVLCLERSPATQVDQPTAAPDPPAPAVTVAVVSAPGGAGATTTTALLGMLLALGRGDRVLAVDPAPGDGSLGDVLVRRGWLLVDELARWLGQGDADLDSRLGWGPHGLMVVVPAAEPARRRRLDEVLWSRMIPRLRSAAGVLLVDGGADLEAPATRAAIGQADRVVLVTAADPAAAALAVETWPLLAAAGAPVTLVVGGMPAYGSRLDLERLARYLPAAGGPVVVPSDPDTAGALQAGELEWSHVPRAWRRAYHQLAATLVAGWDEPSVGFAP